jgi:hypothetical protein
MIFIHKQGAQESDYDLFILLEGGRMVINCFFQMLMFPKYTVCLPRLSV